MSIKLSRPRPASSLNEISHLIPDVLPAGSPPAPSPDGNPANATPPPAPPFLSLREAADWLCVSLSTLKRLIGKGTLATLRVGARRKIPASFLAAYVAREILLPDQVQDKDFPT
jgi:excisionase family DNA binding protein